MDGGEGQLCSDQVRYLAWERERKPEPAPSMGRHVCRGEEEGHPPKGPTAEPFDLSIIAPKGSLLRNSDQGRRVFFRILLLSAQCCCYLLSVARNQDSSLKERL